MRNQGFDFACSVGAYLSFRSFRGSRTLSLIPLLIGMVYETNQGVQKGNFDFKDYFAYLVGTGVVLAIDYGFSHRLKSHMGVIKN